MPDFEKILIKAMEDLARELGHFGLTTGRGRNEKRELETAFQIALGTKLTMLCPGYEWRFGNGVGGELAFDTSALTNGGRIEIDICGACDGKIEVAIELKYVTAHYGRKNGKRHPNDPPAFSYDVTKDCLKMDLLSDNGQHCKQVSHCGRYTIPSKIHTFVVALTNWQSFWGTDGRPWSTHFRHGLTNEQLNIGPVRGSGSGFIQVNPQRNIINTIYYPTKRPHIFLGRKWEGEWREYENFSDAAPYERFCYLLLKPEDDKPQWDGHANTPDTVPFLNLDVCHRHQNISAAWERVKVDLKEFYYRAPKSYYQCLQRGDNPHRQIAKTERESSDGDVDLVRNELRRLGQEDAASHLGRLFFPRL